MILLLMLGLVLIWGEELRPLPDSASQPAVPPATDTPS